MHLVAIEPRRAVDNDAPTSVFIGSSLVIVFADAAEISQAREGKGGLVLLEPPYHVGEEDTYLLLPSDIGEEIVDILRDGDSELLHEALRDGLLVQGEIGRNPRGRGMVLAAERVCQPLSLLGAETPHAATIRVAAGTDALRALNTLPHVQCTTLSALVDDEGLEQVLRADAEFIGCAWRPPASAKRLADIEPTYVWSKRLDDERVGIELALFREDDELVAVLRPAALSL